MNKVKLFSAAAIMALALTASVGVASASASWVVSDAQSTTITGTVSGNQTFTAGFGEFSCSQGSFTGSMSGNASESVTGGLSALGCNVFGATELKPNGCMITLRPGAEKSPGVFGGTFDIGPAGCGPMTLKYSGTCQLSIYPKTGLAAEYQNTGSGSTAGITFTAKATGLKYTNTCGKSGEDGTFNGSWAVKGSSGGSQVGLRVAANAPQGLFTSGANLAAEHYPATVSGSVSKVHRFSTSAGEARCTTGAFGGSLASASSSLALDVQSYSGCTMFGEAASRNAGNCDYSLQVNSAGPPATGTTQIVCSNPGEAITDTLFLFGTPYCTVSYPAQTLGTTTFETVGSGSNRYVVANIEGKGINYTVTGGGGFCGSVGAHSDGTFSGGIALKGLR